MVYNRAHEVIIDMREVEEICKTWQVYPPNTYHTAGLSNKLLLEGFEKIYF